MVLFFQFELKMAVHAARTKRICEVNNFWYFLKKVNFIFIFFQEQLAFLVNQEH